MYVEGNAIKSGRMGESTRVEERKTNGREVVENKEIENYKRTRKMENVHR